MAELTCSTCGAAIQPGDLICFDCGANLARSVPYPSETSPLPNSPMSPADHRNDARRDPTAPMQSNRSLAVCPHCGATVSDPDAAVCMECLRPVSQPNRATHRLIVTLRSNEGDHEISLTDGEELVLGRDPAQSRVVDILAPFDNVSRRHATLFVKDGQAFVRDEGSTNGTFINNTRISPGPRTTLSDGDTLRLAADCTLTVHIV